MTGRRIYVVCPHCNEQYVKGYQIKHSVQCKKKKELKEQVEKATRDLLDETPETDDQKDDAFDRARPSI